MNVSGIDIPLDDVAVFLRKYAFYFILAILGLAGFIIYTVIKVKA